jgi:hypothetical protein
MCRKCEEDKKATTKFQNIIEGWINQAKSMLGILPEDLKAMSERRLAICMGCPQRKVFVCKSCGCPLIAKVKSTGEKCPLNKW